MRKKVIQSKKKIIILSFGNCLQKRRTKLNKKKKLSSELNVKKKNRNYFMGKHSRIDFSSTFSEKKAKNILLVRLMLNENVLVLGLLYEFSAFMSRSSLSQLTKLLCLNWKFLFSDSHFTLIKQRVYLCWRIDWPMLRSWHAFIIWCGKLIISSFRYIL